MEKIKIVYIAGQGRSGSTILDRILGTLDNVSSFAEIYRIWSDGFQDKQLCSCGKSIEECLFWKSILERFIKSESDVNKILDLHKSVDRSSQFLKLYTKQYNSSFKDKLDEHKEWLRKLYFSLAEVSGSSILVDSSKLPSRALILSEIPGIEVYILHVVRDVRAVTYAWKKEKFNPAIGGTMVRYSAYRTVSFWIMRNLFCEMLANRLPYYRVRYEDFATNPKMVLQSLVDKLEPTIGKQLPFVSDDSIGLDPIHTIGGNPHRFRYGVTQIKLDDTWQEKLDSRSQILASVLGSPLLYRYGYF